MKNNFIIGGALLGLLLAGCEGQTAKEVKPNASMAEKAYYKLLSLPQNTDADMEIFARSLAKSLGNPALRSFIKNEAMKQFDGDYDILLKNAVSEKVGDGKLLLELIAEHSASQAGKSTNEFLMELQSISKNNPLFNIAIPVGIENFNPENDVPLVAVLPTNYDENTAVSIKAFAHDGSIVWLDAKKNPKKAVIVVGINERVNAKGQVREGLISLPKEYNASEQRGEISGANQTMGVRMEGSTEKFDGATVSALKNIEDWAAGKPEIEGWIKSTKLFWEGSLDYKGQSTPTIYMHPSRNDIDGKFYPFSLTLMDWYTANYGNTLLYVWNESDPSTGTQSHNVSLPGVASTTFVTGGADEWLGTAEVAFASPLGISNEKTYNTLGIECQKQTSCGFSFRVSATQVQ